VIADRAGAQRATLEPQPLRRWDFPLTPHGCASMSTMAITGVHALVYTSEPEAVRAVLRDVFGWRHVDDGDGWLIFALPPAELGVHPAEGPTFGSGVRHQLTLMCDDISATVRELEDKGIEIQGEPQDEGWGITTTIILPGGVELMLYEPRHRTVI
jgi:predicted enzyme related to lactoylglutathione lyase